MLKKMALWTLPFAAMTLIVLSVYTFQPPANAASSDCCTWTDDALPTAAPFTASDSRLKVTPLAASATTMHVAEIRVGWTYGSGWNRRPYVLIRILDATDLPVYGAKVTGNWSGCFKQNGVVTGPTDDVDLNNDHVITDDEKGWVRMDASKTGSCHDKQCYFTFAVTNVSNTGYTYDETQNIETTDFVKCNLFLP